MCVSPRTIAVKNLIAHAGMYERLGVPCGQCYQCRDAKMSAFLVRAYYEHKDSAYSFFDTLTYNDACLPHYGQYPLFCRKDVQKFLKRLRIACQRWILEKYGLTCKSPFKFLVTAEYGGLKGRPHYHILFHVKCANLDVHSFKQLINKCWTFGFTDSIFSTDSHVVTSLDAVKYVTKYVCKDVTSRVKERVAFEQYCKDNNIEDNKFNFRDFRKQYGWFWQCSVGYGVSLLQNLTNDEVEKRVCHYVDKDNLRHEIALPRYYVMKLYKRLVEIDTDHNVLVDTSLGVDTLIKTLENRIKHTSLHFSDVLYNIGFGEISPCDLAVYHHCFRGKSLPFQFDIKDWRTQIKYLTFTEDVLQSFFDGYKYMPFFCGNQFRFERELNRIELYDAEMAQLEIDKIEYKDALYERRKCLT